MIPATVLRRHGQSNGLRRHRERPHSNTSFPSSRNRSTLRTVIQFIRLGVSYRTCCLSTPFHKIHSKFSKQTNHLPRPRLPRALDFSKIPPCLLNRNGNFMRTQVPDNHISVGNECLAAWLAPNGLSRLSVSERFRFLGIYPSWGSPAQAWPQRYPHRHNDSDIDMNMSYGWSRSTSQCAATRWAHSRRRWVWIVTGLPCRVVRSCLRVGLDLPARCYLPYSTVSGLGDIQSGKLQRRRPRDVSQVKNIKNYGSCVNRIRRDSLRVARRCSKMVENTFPSLEPIASQSASVLS